MSDKTKAAVTRLGVLDMQVCVPEEWTDDRVIKFANSENPCGATGGWQIRKEGDPLLMGDPERQSCYDPKRKDFVHIMLDC